MHYSYFFFHAFHWTNPPFITPLPLKQHSLKPSGWVCVHYSYFLNFLPRISLDRSPLHHTPPRARGCTDTQRRLHSVRHRNRKYSPAKLYMDLLQWRHYHSINATIKPTDTTGRWQPAPSLSRVYRQWDIHLHCQQLPGKFKYQHPSSCVR